MLGIRWNQLEKSWKNHFKSYFVLDRGRQEQKNTYGVVVIDHDWS